jgi:hypothetical protein
MRKVLFCFLSVYRGDVRVPGLEVVLGFKDTVVALLVRHQLRFLDSRVLHRKKRFTSFPSPAGMSLTKLPLSRNNSVMTSLFPPRESLVVTSRLGTGNSRTFFLRCSVHLRFRPTLVHVKFLSQRSRNCRPCHLKQSSDIEEFYVFTSLGKDL